MNATLASKKALKAKAEIRWFALWFAAFVWGLGTLFGTGVRGKTLQQANSDATAAAIAGLAAWTVYHIVSRRNNGLCMVMASLPMALQPHRGIGFLATLGILLVALVPLAWLIGQFGRRLDSKAECSVPASTDAMYDAEMDGLKNGE